MGFYELGNGCDTCDTVSSILPNNVNMQMDPNSSMVASMVMPYGTQNNMQKQYNGAIVSGYGSQGSNFGMMGNGSNGSTMGAPQTTQQAMIMVPANTVISQPMKQITAPGPVAVVVPSANSAPATTSTKVAEGFTDGSSGSMMNHKMWIVLGLVIFSALAGNECCKYFLNKSLQLNDGSPLYYVAYVGVAVLLTFATYTYATKN